MKKPLILIATFAAVTLSGCTAIDTTGIWNAIEDLKDEQEKMQEQLDAQQALLNALANNLSIVSIAPTEEGFLLTLSDGTTFPVKHGEKGEKGEKGDDGDTLFQSVTWDDNYVYFTLADGTMITIPLTSDDCHNETTNSFPPANQIWYTSIDGNIVKPY